MSIETTANLAGLVNQIMEKVGQDCNPNLGTCSPALSIIMPNLSVVQTAVRVSDSTRKVFEILFSIIDLAPCLCT